MKRLLLIAFILALALPVAAQDLIYQAHAIRLEVASGETEITVAFPEQIRGQVRTIVYDAIAGPSTQDVQLLASTTISGHTFTWIVDTEDNIVASATPRLYNSTRSYSGATLSVRLYSSNADGDMWVLFIYQQTIP